MEFHEKLQELRKQRGMTQEELAEALFVSRTAISKWESGRGMPNVESLKAISKFFTVTLDDLLSSEALLVIAEDDRRQKESDIRDMVYGLLDCSMAMLLVLPFFRQTINGAIQGVSLLALMEIQPYLKISYFVVVLCMAILGGLTLALRKCSRMFWKQNKICVSLGVNTIAVLLFIVSQQPYAAVFSFVFLGIKSVMLIKQ